MWEQFKIAGTRVVYTGRFSSEKKGCTGTVVACSPSGEKDNGPININVVWDDGDEFLGVFPENITLLHREAEWEL